MPQGDRTGPQGQGPMTGRGLCVCGRGLRQGFGKGFGRRFAQPVQFSEADEKKVLEAELKEIEAEKEEIKGRLKELK